MGLAVFADPKPVSADEVDALILTALGPGRWRKTAAVIGHALRALEHQHRAVTDAAIFGRLQLLVDRGLVQTSGDISRWRLSEVRPTGKIDRFVEISLWARDLEKGLPAEDAINRVRERLNEGVDGDRDGLIFELRQFLTTAGRYDEALQLIDGEIERRPDDVRYPISKATLCHYNLDDPERALVCIDFALERAFRTRFFRREALGEKARILLKLGRGHELGQVLERIMSLDMYRGVPDIAKEDDFVKRAPSGLISEDIVARYKAFCPDRQPEEEIDFWVNRQQEDFPVDEVIARVRSRLQDADERERLRLSFRLRELLVNSERYDEALRLADDVLARNPDNSSFAIWKAKIYHDYLDETSSALQSIDDALERAFRSRDYRRAALGDKARVLLTLKRGEELGQVLEQIMSLQMFHDAVDTPRERDFVDDAPAGLIAPEIIARYNAYCPQLDPK
jgi:tetratricopeptide (TPR) repeat protein